MICPECRGKGAAIYYRETDRDENSVTVQKFEDICNTCHGSGRKPQTNADKIRAMSDEELANFLAAKFSDLQQAQQFFNESSTVTATELYALSHSWYCAWMQWLKQPVTEDNDGTAL